MKKVGAGVGQVSVHAVGKSRYLEEEEGRNTFHTKTKHERKYFFLLDFPGLGALLIMHLAFSLIG